MVQDANRPAARSTSTCFTCRKTLTRTRKGNFSSGCGGGAAAADGGDPLDALLQRRFLCRLLERSLLCLCPCYRLHPCLRGAGADSATSGSTGRVENPGSLGDALVHMDLSHSVVTTQRSM